MKKIISAILAMAMCLSLMGGITVSAAATAKEYHFANNTTAMYGVNTSGTSGYTATNGEWHAFQVTGFGDHGWYPYAVDYEETTDFHYRMLQVTDIGLSIRADYKTDVSTSGIQAAFVLEAPEAGYYEVSEGMFTEGNTLYMSKALGNEDPQKNMTEYSDYKKDLSAYIKAENLIGTSGTITGFSNDGTIECHDLNKVVYSDGTTNLVLAVDVPDGVETQLRAIKLTPASGEATLKLGNSRIMPGQTTKATVMVGETELADSFVTYSVPEGTTCVEIDSATGKITALAKGTATVTATIDDSEVYTATITVVDTWEYHFAYGDALYGVDKNGSGFTTTSGEWHAFLVTGFGDHGWYSYAVDYDETAEFTYCFFRVLDGYTQINPAYNNSLSDIKAAFVLKAPVKGFYDVRANVSTAGNVFYIGKAGSEVDPQASMTDYANYNINLDSYATSRNYVGESKENSNGFDSTKKISSYDAFGSVIYSDGESDLLLVVDVPGTQAAQLRAASLVGYNSYTPTVTVENPSLEKGAETVAKLTVNNSRAFVNSFVDWSVEGESVEIDDCGNITAVSAGTATVKATVGDVTYTATVTVTAPEEDTDLTGAFTVVETTGHTYTESTVTGLTSDGTIETIEGTVSGTFTLTASEADDEKGAFLYWAKGMTNDKKIVSFSNVLENYMPEESGKNYLIAVYEGDMDADTAEYFNQNGQRIAKGTVGGEKPALPSMAGFGTAKKWVQCGELNIWVAQYDATTPDEVTITVENGTGGGTVPFGTEVTCTAAAEDESGNPFKCWTKSDINGNTEIVSVDSTYKFKAWEKCTVTAVYEDHYYTGNTMKIIIDTFTAGSETGVMAEFIGLDSAVEKGIMYNGTKIAMTTKDNQFTVIADEPGAYIGYAILKNSDNTFSLITDGEYVKSVE